MIKLKLPFTRTTNHDIGSNYISIEEYTDVMDYARKNGVKLEGFKRFSGNIGVIKEMIDDIVSIAHDFPKILNSSKSVVISNDTNSLDDDFATTINHIVYINAHIYNNLDYLKDEYDIVAQRGHFVKNTTYRSIIRHELGHVVSNMYKLDPMMVARMLLPDKTSNEIIKYVKETVSLYAADYPDGREFISECFSAYYSGVDNDFAKQYVLQCQYLIKEAYVYDKK